MKTKKSRLFKCSWKQRRKKPINTAVSRNLISGEILTSDLNSDQIKLVWIQHDYRQQLYPKFGWLMRFDTRIPFSLLRWCIVYSLCSAKKKRERKTTKQIDSQFCFSVKQKACKTFWEKATKTAMVIDCVKRGFFFQEKKSSATLRIEGKIRQSNNIEIMRSNKLSIRRNFQK